MEEFSPYTMVAIQESERMNILTAEMKRSLAELDLGLRGDLTMSEPMERLMHALARDAVPASWRNLAYPSLRPLASWFANVQARRSPLLDVPAAQRLQFATVPKVGTAACDCSVHAAAWPPIDQSEQCCFCIHCVA